MKKLYWILSIAFILSFLALVHISSARVSEENSKSFRVLKSRPTLKKPASVSISQEADFHRVIIKFREKTDVRLRSSQLVSLKGFSMKAANSVLEPYSNERLARLFKNNEEELEKTKRIYELISGWELADLNLYYQLDITDYAEAESIINRLNGLNIVEIAYIDPKSEPAEDIDPPTPDYEPYQDYLLAAPTGVDALYAKTLPGGDGAGIKIIDIEHAWNESHEDLEKAVGGTIAGGNDPGGNHGTAVLGEMIAGDNGYGVTGICPGADIGMASAAINGTVNAIMMAIDNLDRGDLMLIELHAPGPRYNFEIRSDQLGYVCMEYWQDRFDALQYAWAKGIIVVEAAGNGAEDYDNPLYDHLFDTTYRNSHAIIAGAGAPPSGNHGPDRSRLDFSNYGERVNLQGYGREVFTTGYGDYWDGDGDTNQYYTSTFAGTSSASPIVTGAVACLQGYYKANYGVPLTSDYTLQVLNATGSSQQGDTGEHIGPRPDLASAIAALMPPPSLFTEPIYIDTTMEQGTTATLPLWLYNRSSGYGVDFSIEGNDSLPKSKIADWLKVLPETGTVPPSDSVQLMVTLDAAVIEDRWETYKGIIEIGWGVSGGSLDSSTFVPVFLSVPCVPDMTFAVSSSNDPEGPEYDWIEITDIGTMIPRGAYYNSYADNALDDGTAGPFELPFDFQFYDLSYNQIYVGVNGAISFTEEEVNSRGYFSGFDIPGNPFSTFVAVFWNDLIIGDDFGSHGDIYYYHSPTNDTTIIEWSQVGNFNAATDTMTTFEIILTIDGNIIFQYKDVGETGLENTALIGLNMTECTATPYFDSGIPAERTVGNMVTVLFDQSVEAIMSGDCNNDGSINILDITYLITYLYKNGPAPDPLPSGDPNCDSNVNILDITFLISYLYKSGPAPCYYLP